MKDKFGRKVDYLRLSVTDNCNLRCIYCMEEKTTDFLKEKSKLTDNEILKIVESSASIGVSKVRITGGEPLVRAGIVDLIGKIKSIDGIEEIYLTTNATLLNDKVEILAKNGLNGVNISLDSLNKEKFDSITRLGGFEKVMESIDKCIKYGLKVKLNTVIVNNINADEILDFINLTLKKPIDVRFIELMPIGVGKVYKGMSNEEVLDVIKNNYTDLEEVDSARNDGPAKYIKVNKALGRVGFISAMSNCFCEACNRIRVTPEGFLKQCLHFDYGVSLRDLIRNGISKDELTEVIKENIYNKPEKHLFNQNGDHEEIRFMNKIGG